MAKKAPVTSIEWQQTLCQTGQAEALKRQITQSFKQADVLAGEADDDINASSHAIALHACGDLHLHLIKQAVEKQPAEVTISPCCYHLTRQSTYLPCSKLGQKSSLKISKQVLKLAVSKQATSGKRQARLSELGSIMAFGL
ncbi:methyltransferase [Psychromonas sp. KJ10-10]|uniref:methyltransferase n=1 Tax=Psychromonas sp. KJ10-10 TaxID=3391823 RepID=UPI0039B5FBEA